MFRFPSSQAISKPKHFNYCKKSSRLSESSELLQLVDDRKWMLVSPETQIHKISVSKKPQLQPQHPGSNPLVQFSFSKNDHRPDVLGNDMTRRREGGEAITPSSSSSFFYVVRDDLLHPLVNGNKARKLDAVLPILHQHFATDVVTCGGCQSAHAAALAVSCAERGIRSHLLLRGEQPQIPTGYNLISLMYANTTTYVPRSLYAHREEMLTKHADLVAGDAGSVVWLDDIILNNALTSWNSDDDVKVAAPPLNDGPTSFLPQSEAKKDSKKVVIVSEGAGDTTALLGIIRLVRYLSQAHVFGTEHQIEIVLDAGTGTTAVGLAIGIIYLGLPWKVNAIMLADTIEGYKKQEKHLISEFKRIYGFEYVEHTLDGVDDGIVHWVERIHPRKFGKVLKGEIELCQQIAQQTGILVDPVYTLAAWEYATLLSSAESEKATNVVMLHTGGTLGMFGLAQRYTSYFHTAE